MDFSNKLVLKYQDDADYTLARVCRWVALLMFLLGLLNFLGVFVIKGTYMYAVIALSILIAFMPTIFFNILNIHETWVKYMLLTALVLMNGIMYSIVSYHAVIMLVFPLICSCLYGEQRRILYTMIISVPVIIISHLVALKLSVVPDEPLVTLHGVIFYGIIPRLIQLGAVGMICIGVTNKLKDVNISLINKNNELYENQQSLIESLSDLIETQSQETGQHVKRVSEYTRIMCEGMGYTSDVIWNVSIASMMHDVGKLLVPHEIIEKPGRLTDEEFEQVKLHVDYGKKMLENSPGEIMRISAVIAYEHHEKWNGTGYKHLKGKDISTYAQIVAIADVFDALVSRRPYKKAWTNEEAYEEIVAQSGRQFDPQLVDIFKNKFHEFEEVRLKYPES